MKRFLPMALIGALFVVALISASSKCKSKSAELDRESNFARIQQQYLERVGWIRSNPDEKSFKDEVGTFFRWYFKEIGEHHNKFQLNREFDDYLSELERRGGKDAQVADKKAYYAYTRKVFDQFRSGNYAPLWTGTDKGMRLDVVSADVEMIAGKPQIRFALVLWGAQRELRDDGRGMKKMVTSSTFNVTWKLTDDKGKLIGEMSASGDPSMKVDWPDRFIAEFPPQMVLGHYDIDPVPANATKTEITFGVSSSSPSGGQIASNFVWKLDTPSTWRLKDGEKWEGAEISERPEEEIDPAAAARAR